MTDWQTNFTSESRRTREIARQFRDAARKRPQRLELPAGGEGSYIGLELAYSIRKEGQMPYGWGASTAKGQVFAFCALSADGRKRLIVAATDRELVEKARQEPGWLLCSVSWK